MQRVRGYRSCTSIAVSCPAVTFDEVAAWLDGQLGRQVTVAVAGLSGLAGRSLLGVTGDLSAAQRDGEVTGTAGRTLGWSIGGAAVLLLRDGDFQRADGNTGLLVIETGESRIEVTVDGTHPV